MAASVWSGYLTFGLISMPVRLFSGARSSGISFNQLHRTDHQRVKQQLICPADNQVLERSDIVKGFEYRKGEYVIIDPEEIKKIRVRFRKLPDRFSLRKVGQAQLSKLLLVDGIIVRSTPVRPLVTRAAFQCRKCNSLTFVEQSGIVMREPELCGRCRSKLLDFSEKQSTFINSQELRMQERPEDLPPGQLL